MCLYILCYMFLQHSCSVFNMIPLSNLFKDISSSGIIPVLQIRIQKLKEIGQEKLLAKDSQLVKGREGVKGKRIL